MSPVVTQSLVLSRLNYGEADRILTILTPDQGKVSVIAKGVRKKNSKLAGGIELFSVNDVSFISGKSELKTLTSSRLHTHFSHIAKDLDRANAAYEILKLIKKHKSDDLPSDYFEITVDTLCLLDETSVAVNLALCWFYMQLLMLEGHSPNLGSDTAGNTLQEKDNFLFDFDAMAFVPQASGPYDSSHVRLLRALGSSAKAMTRLQLELRIVDECLTLLRNLHNANLS